MQKFIISILIVILLISCGDSFTYSGNKTNFKKSNKVSNEINVSTNKKVKIECLINLKENPVSIVIKSPNGIIENINHNEIGITEIYKEFDNIKGSWSIEIKSIENNAAVVYKIHTKNKFEKFNDSDFKFVGEI